MAASDHPTLGFSRNRKEKPAVSRSNDNKFCIVNFPCCSCTTELNRNLSQNERQDGWTLDPPLYAAISRDVFSAQTTLPTFCRSEFPFFFIMYVPEKYR